MKTRTTAFIASSLVLIIIVLIDLFFVYVFQKSSWHFPLDSNLKKQCDETVQLLRFYMADYDESDLTGEYSENRRAIYFSEGTATFVHNEKDAVPEKVLYWLDKLSEIRSHQNITFDRTITINEEKYLLSGRAMGRGDSLIFRGYLTKRDYFVENAQNILMKQVKWISDGYGEENWESIDGTFYLIDSISGKYSKLFGTGTLSPDLPEDKYFKIKSDYVLMDGLEVAVLYSLSYSKSYFEQATIRTVAFMVVLIIMNFLYFRKK